MVYTYQIRIRYVSDTFRYPIDILRSAKKVAHSAKDTVFEEGEVGFDRPFLMKDQFGVC